MIAHIASKESILFRRAQFLRVQFAILTVKVMSMPERQPITIPPFSKPSSVVTYVLFTHRFPPSPIFRTCSLN